MSRRAILFRFLGSGWLTLGLICLSVGSLQIIAPDRVDWWGKLAASGNIDTSRLVLHLPLLAITLLAWGLMSALLGWNLIRLTSWAQPLAQTSHLLLAVYLATGLTTSLAVSPQVRGYTLVGLSLLVGNLGLAYLLRGRLADEVFSQVPWQTAPVIPMRCEFCGSTLHRGTGRCPECEPVIQTEQFMTGEERAKPALVAQLESLDDGTVYRLASRQPTFVGRELSGNDINLSNPTVSRRHARIEYDIQNRHYILISMQDTNGTFVNERLVRRKPLRDSDEVRFGRARFRFNITCGSNDTGG